ncbi:pilus assembly protein [Pseudomonas sp. NPDC090202]|uniref:pilus assembly protein n=1 Tax=unclassified Pseudomonas TaxID=196821 RepID=UPI00382E55C1
MTNQPKAFSRCIAILTCLLLVPFSFAQAAVSQVPAQLPLFVNNSVPPLNMLVVGRDHKLFFPAYNDASDLDGDGSIDIRYKPSIDYLGYFDSLTCYSYGSGYFTAASKTTKANLKKCPGSWSGDYLNYLTTSRADALRKVLYGGYREVDTTTQTILTRAYIPTDAHTWGKEYRSPTVDGYNLSDYTPLSNPTGSNYTLFANNTQSSAPLLRVLSNVSNIRIFGWVSREVTQGGSVATNTSFQDVVVTPTDYQVRVEVCKTGFLESNCKLYPNGKYKPTGILHDYGEGNQMYFGLMTGTYQNNIQGGAIRKAISSFSDEIETSTGIFGTKNVLGVYVKSGIIGTLDGLRLTSSGCSTSGNSITNGACQNWGNPLAEMMFETLRYFSGTTTPTTGFLSGAGDTLLGLSGLTSWVNPYSSTPDANASPPTFPYCAKPFETLFSDVNPTYDSDLPGSAYSTTNAPSTTTALNGFSAQSLGQTIWNTDVGAGNKNINIGQTPSVSDLAPTSKVASSLGNIRGLPEEPTKQGTFNAGAVAYFGNTNPITSLGSQKVQTFSIALSSTLPRIQMPVGDGTITLLPFGKVTSGVTEQITGFYIDSMYNMPGQPTDTTVNGGRAQAIFRVVFDDCGQGCDYDMDAIVLYTVAVNASGTLDVTLQTAYSVSGAESHMGYTISGTTNDGIYIEVTGGGSANQHYSLDTPGTRLPGDCVPSNACTGTSDLLPGKNGSNQTTSRGDTHTRRFTPSSARSVTNLQDPLWYAAKWGGFGGAANTSTSTPADGEWDSNNSGTPNNYFLVSNASTLKQQLDAAFNQILQKNSSVSAPAVTPALGTNNSTATYLNSLNVATWSGDLIKSTTTYTSTNPNGTTVQNWSASAQMPVWSSRNIVMANEAGSALVPFTYANLASRTFAGVALQGTLTSDQVDFIKGDTSKAVSNFRRRGTLIGDLVNSSPVVVSNALYEPTIADTLNGTAGTYATFRTSMSTRRGQIYVGSNDGMLHGFDTATGVEKFAFIPSAVIANLNVLTNKDYNTNSALHRYFVDNTPVVADVYFGGAWHTILVGSLGGGGREVFALDVTNPDNITLLWEFTSQNDVDLGSTFSIPVVVKLHSGEWGVVFGNGYNGNNGNASLFVLNASTGAVISKLTTSVQGNNGLSSPVILDANSDGIADYAYAGDLLGNLWRFDLIGSGSLTATAVAGNYKVSFSNKPLYTATVSDTANSAVQSITAPPTVIAHPSAAGTLVIFGTGRYFASADKTSTDLQTLYGIWDKQTAAQTASSTPVLNRSTLQAQTITSQANNVDFSGTSNNIRLVSQNTVDWNSKYGWYLDFSVGGSLLGERLVDPLNIVGSVLLASTRTPSNDVCSPGVSGWIYGLNPYTGGRTTFTVFNLRRNGTISSADNYNDNVVSGYSSAAGSITASTTNDGSNNSVVIDPSGQLTRANDDAFLDGRQNWRVIPYQ